MPIKSNRMSKKLTILLVSVFLAVVAMVLAIGISGAWFTDSDTKTKNSTTPNIVTTLVNSSGTGISNFIVLNTSTTVSVKVDANVDVYIRAKVVAQFVDGDGNFVAGYDVADYYNITYNASWGTPAGYNANFLYYGSPTVIGTAATTSPITTTLITGVTSIQALPAGVSSVKLQLFAEAVQGNATGLAAWAA